QARLRYPFDEYWFSFPVMLFNMSDPADTVGDWEWTHKSTYYKQLKLFYWNMPSEWRFLMNEWIGIPNTMISNVVADMIYIPKAYQQLEVFHTVLKQSIQLTRKEQEDCIFSELFLPPLVYLSMLLANDTSEENTRIIQTIRPSLMNRHIPILPFPTQGPNYDRQYETLYFHNRGDKSIFYSQIQTFLKDTFPDPSVAPLVQIRPIPLRIDGYRWNRDDMEFLEWMLLKADGDPVFVHPVKLSNPDSIPSKLNTQAQEKMIQKLFKAKQRKKRRHKE